MRALVLSGGGLFGAWQAGAWPVVARHFQPDLIVGASVGSLNGYLIASGASPGQLHEYWRSPEFGDRRKLKANLKLLTGHYQLQRPFALTVTDLLRMKPRIYRDSEITWKHLAASCAIPLVLPQRWIDGRLMSDGGLLNILPLWAAVELGATEVVAMNVLADFPAPWLEPPRKLFRRLFGFPQGVFRGGGKRRSAALWAGSTVRFGGPLNRMRYSSGEEQGARFAPDDSGSGEPETVTAPKLKLLELVPSRVPGRMRDMLVWDRSNIDRWLEEGAREAAAQLASHAREKPFPF